MKKNLVAVNYLAMHKRNPNIHSSNRWPACVYKTTVRILSHMLRKQQPQELRTNQKQTGHKAFEFWKLWCILEIVLSSPWILFQQENWSLHLVMMIIIAMSIRRSSRSHHFQLWNITWMIRESLQCWKQLSIYRVLYRE